MAIIGFQEFFKIPLLSKLEEDIEEKFGKKGLEKFNKSQTLLEINTDNPPTIKPKWGEMLKDPFDENPQIGYLLMLNNAPGEISGFLVKNATTQYVSEVNFTVISYQLTEDKYLKIAFKT